MTDIERLMCGKKCKINNADCPNLKVITTNKLYCRLTMI